MKFHWSVLFGGLILAVIAGLVVDWIERRTIAQTAGDSSWNLSLTRSNFPSANSGCGSDPATTFPVGAQDTRYRRFVRIGSATVDMEAQA